MFKVKQNCPSLAFCYKRILLYHSSKGLDKRSEGEQAIKLVMSILQRFDLSFFNLSSPENNKCPSSFS